MKTIMSRHDSVEDAWRRGYRNGRQDTLVTVSMLTDRLEDNEITLEEFVQYVRELT